MQSFESHQHCKYRCSYHPVGVTTSGMYGHRLNASLGMGYVKLGEPITAELIQHTRFEIDVAGQRVACQAQFSPWYDAKNEKIRS